MVLKIINLWPCVHWASGFTLDLTHSPVANGFQPWASGSLEVPEQLKAQPACSDKHKDI